MWNIRNKILLIFLPVVLIPLISVSTFFAIHTAKSLKQSKIDELQSITKRKVEMAVSFVRSIDYDIRILGKNKFLSNLTDAVAGEDTEQINHWKSELEMLFTTFAESKKIYDQMCYIDKSGRELVRVDLLYRDYADIVTTKDLQDNSHRHYFQAAMNLDEGKIYISKLNLNREKGEIESPHKPVLQYATPVFDSENQKRGVFVLSVRADYLIKNILTHKFNRGLDSYFLDKEGFYLLHSDVSKRWGGSDDLNTGENLNNDFPQESASLILSGKPGIILIDEHLFNYVPIYFDPSNVERYWIYMESLDESTIYSPIYAFYKIFGVLIFVLITSGVMATLFFSRSLTRPLSKLVEGASRISEGDFSYRIKVKSSDEIGCLTNTFNGMTLRLEEAERKLRDHAVNLEKKVEEKTEEIIRRKEYTENLIETAQDAIICIDENWIINIWNQMAEKIFRYSKGEIVGKSIHTIIPERYMKEQEEDVSLLLKTDVYRKTWKILKMSAINRTGQVIPIEMSLACNKAEKDKLSFTFIIRDITDRNRMEEMLLRSEKLKALGVMTSGISHEFNNILAIIRGNAILIEKGYSDHPKLMEKLNVIIEKSGAGAEVVRRMQDFADKEKDTAIIPVDIRDITIQAINFTTPSWKNIALSNGIKYDIEQKDLKPVPTVLGNPTELKDVLLNMINNAMQAMPGGGRLSFRTWSEDNTVYLSISDTGVGMSKDLQKKVFDPFFTTRPLKGRGLGLSASYGIIKRHGGKIVLEREEGKGCIFTLELPISSQR